MHRFEKLHNEFEVLRLVWCNARGQHLRLSLAMMLELLFGLVPPAAVYVLQRAVGLKATNIESLLTQYNVILVLAVYFVYLALTKVSRIMTAYSIIEVEYNMRMQFVRAMKDMSYADVTNKIGLQSSNGLTQEISMASGLIPMVYRSFIRATVTIIAFCVLSFIVSPHFFLVVFMLSVAVVAAIVILRQRIKTIHQMLFNRISSLYQLFAEWLNGYRVFRVYNSMDFAVHRMDDVFQSVRSISRRLTVTSNMQKVLAEMITYSVAAAIIVMMPTENGVINLGVLISYPAAIIFIRGELMVLVSGYQQLANTESSIKRLFEMINTPPSSEAKVRNIGDVAAISFDDVTYSYHPDTDEPPILRHAQLQLQKGHLNVITGPSGIGKSTTLNLLLGLLHAQQGTITHHPASGNQQPASDTHQGIALVEQEPFFFDGTLYDNLCMGRTGIAVSDIMHYLDVLHMSHLFPTEESLTEKTEMFNRRLSTGEKQRLALIRALIGRPSVLVIDEVTSNIDAATSQLIIDYLHQLSQEVLVVAVSHDPVFISQADVIYQLKDKRFEGNKK